MVKKTLFVYNSINLFKILNEIEEYFHFETKYIDEKNFKNFDFKEYENYIIISNNNKKLIESCITINDLPKKIYKLVELINLNFLKIQFQNQSGKTIGKYTLDLNSRKISLKDKSLNLTEKEGDLIVFINSSKKASLKNIQKMVWGHSDDLETHTVETHIYRLRKKMLKNFNDNNFIKHDHEGYYLD